MTEPDKAGPVSVRAQTDPLPVPSDGSGSASDTGAVGWDPGAVAASVPREPKWQVARSAIGLWTLELILRSVVLMIPAVLASIFVPNDAPRWLVVATDILPWALAVLLLAVILVLPRYKYAVHRWEVTADGIYTLTGWLSRTWILVPISRIQTVDVTRGPLQRLFGLASVSVRTASAHGSVEIHQLDHYAAAQVADDLSKRANLYDDDAT